MWKLRQLSSQRFIQKVNFISLINRRGGEKKVVILLQFTRNFFFMVQIHPNLQRIFLLWGGVGGWCVGTLLVPATILFSEVRP